MIKTDWTKEEVRKWADQCQVAGWPTLETILRAFAARIEADESAVPICWSLRHKDGTGTLFDDCIYDNEDDAQNDATALNGGSGQLIPVPLFTHPPAQPAQEQPGWKVPDAFVKLHEAASKGFHTSESCGPESLYMHKSQFPTLQDLFDFEDAWRKAMLAASPTPPKEK